MMSPVLCPTSHLATQSVVWSSGKSITWELGKRQDPGRLPKPTELKSLGVGPKPALHCPGLPALSPPPQRPLPLCSTWTKTYRSSTPSPDATPFVNLHVTYFSLRQIHCPSCSYHLQNIYHPVLFCLLLWMFTECHQILCQGLGYRRKEEIIPYHQALAAYCD